jgi:hypothetical protein
MIIAIYNSTTQRYAAEGREAGGKDGLRSLCRKLVEGGHSGSMTVVDAHTTQDRIVVGNIVAAAKTSLTENDRGFRVVKYRPNPFAETPA